MKNFMRIRTQKNLYRFWWIDCRIIDYRIIVSSTIDLEESGEEEECSSGSGGGGGDFT